MLPVVRMGTSAMPVQIFVASVAKYVKKIKLLFIVGKIDVFQFSWVLFGAIFNNFCCLGVFGSWLCPDDDYWIV